VPSKSSFPIANTEAADTTSLYASVHLAYLVGMKRPEDDLAQRQVVWDAMHVLWLDTDTDAFHLEAAARTCAATDYAIEDIELIYWNEVYPVMRRNLWSVAGEWTPLRPEALYAENLKHHRFGKHIWFRSFRRVSCENWEKLAAKVTALRAGR
jgi:hypothetical protein